MHFSIIALATPLLLAARSVAYLSHLMKLGKVVLLLTGAFISVPSLVIIASVRMAMVNIMNGPSFAVITSHPPLTHITMIKSTRYIELLPLIIFLFLPALVLNLPQCSNSAGSLDSGAFVACCQRFGAGGAFCWD